MRRFNTHAFISFTLAALALLSVHNARAETLRLTAATPLSSYADPLAFDSGNGLIPAIFDGLTIISVEGNVEPGLALSWKLTSDTTWEFELRPDVVFHDGTPFTAETAADFLNFIALPESAGFPVAGDAVTIDSVRTLGPLTIEITTKQPDAVLPRRLNRLRVIPLDTWKEMGRTEFSRNPIGTGAYKVVEWSRGGSFGVVLGGVETSWRAPKQIDRVEYVILPDASTRLQSLMAGQADFASTIDTDAIPTVEAAGYKVRLEPGPINLALALHNCGKPSSSPMADRRVRLALNMAIDKNRIVEQLLGGTTEVAIQGAMPGVLGYNPDIEPYPYDPEGAKALLAEAGYEDGLDIVVGLATGQLPGDSLVYQQVAQDWATVGVNAELRQMVFSEYNRRALAADWEGVDAITAVWSHYHLGDVSFALKRFIGLRSGPYFCAPDLHEDFTASDQIMNEQERDKALQDLMIRLHDQVPHVPLMRYVSIDGLSPRIVEFKSRTGAILFEEMEFTAN